MSGNALRLSRCLFTDWDQQKSVKFVRREFRQNSKNKEENSDENTFLQFSFKKRKKSSTFYCRKRIFTCKSNLTSFFKVYFWPIFANFYSEIVETFQFSRFFSQSQVNLTTFSPLISDWFLFISRFSTNKSIWRVF